MFLSTPVFPAATTTSFIFYIVVLGRVKVVGLFGGVSEVMVGSQITLPKEVADDGHMFGLVKFFGE